MLTARRVDSYTGDFESITSEDFVRFLRSEDPSKSWTELKFSSGIYHNPIHFKLMVHRNTTYYFASFAELEDLVKFLRKNLKPEKEIWWFGVTTTIGKIDPERIL